MTLESVMESNPWQTHVEAEAKEQQYRQTLAHLTSKLTLIEDDTHKLRQKISDGNALIVQHSDARDAAHVQCSKLHCDARVCLLLFMCLFPSTAHNALCIGNHVHKENKSARVLISVLKCSMHCHLSLEWVACTG
jgi:hypothetical protein